MRLGGSLTEQWKRPDASFSADVVDPQTIPFLNCNSNIYYIYLSEI